MNKLEQLSHFLEQHPRFMSAVDIKEAGFKFAGQKETSVKDIKNIMSKLQDVERAYDENMESRIMAANALWRKILRRKR